jgi:hypothetical protein
MAAEQPAVKTSSEAALEQLQSVLQRLQLDAVVNGQCAREGRAAAPAVDDADVRELQLAAAAVRAEVRELEEANKGLEQQLQAAKEQLTHLQGEKDAAEAAAAGLKAWVDGDALHPSCVGMWTADHYAEGMSVFADHIIFQYPAGADGKLDAGSKNIERGTWQVERCAPYAFVVQHAWGNSMFVLLPCGRQMIEVNYSREQRWLWGKA